MPGMTEWLERLLSVPDQSQAEPASPAALAEYERGLGFSLPANLRALLLVSNGGEWCFGRFERPLVRSDDPWDLDHPLVRERQMLPLCTDYSEGVYGLEPDSGAILLIAWPGAEAERVADSFDAFVEGSVAESLRVRHPFHLAVSLEGIERPSPELAPFGLELRRVDLELVLARERESSFFDEAREGPRFRPDRAVAVTVLDPTGPASLPYGVVHEASGLNIRSASLTRGGKVVSDSCSTLYLTQQGRLIPVWHVSGPETLGPDHRLELEGEYFSSPPA